MSGTNETSEIYFIPDKLSIATVPFPLTKMNHHSNFYFGNNGFVKLFKELMIIGHMNCATTAN